MKPTEEVGQGDLAPAFEAQLLGTDRQPPDLTGKTVTCRVILPGGRRGFVDSVPTLVEPRVGYVRHDWAVKETVEPGVLWVFFTVDDGVNAPVSYPPWGYYTVRVLPKLS